MVGGFWTGYSGINTYERAINNVSNNSTNINTVGHKSNEIRFEDLMYKNGIGKGSDVQTIDKSMKQGEIKNTGNAFDVAIEGRGYFLVNNPDSSEPLYTRAGNFKMGGDGTLQSQNNYQILGRGYTLTNTISTDPADTKFSNEYSNFIASNNVITEESVFTINGRATDYTKTAVDSGISGSGFKTASAKIVDAQALMNNYREKISLYESAPTAPSVASTTQRTEVTYTNSLNRLQDENDFITITVNNIKLTENFDTSIENTLKKLSDKISNLEGITSSIDTNSGILTIESLIPGNSVSIFDAAINNSAVNIANTQEPSVGSGYAMVESARDALKSSIELAGGKYLEFTSSVVANSNDLNGLSQINLKLDDLNLSENVFGEVTIEDGYVYLTHDNNKFIVSKLETAFFTNENGLYAAGDNMYESSPESGAAKNVGKTNKLVSESLELSNISSSDSMSDLLVFQKAFEANAKALTTSDEMLKLALQLRK